MSHVIRWLQKFCKFWVGLYCLIFGTGPNDFTLDDDGNVVPRKKDEVKR